MLPSNADPRRPDKVHRYKPKGSNGGSRTSNSPSKKDEVNDTTNNSAQGEDLTPDYMNILGQHATTANAAEATDKQAEGIAGAEGDQPVQQTMEDNRQGAEDVTDSPTAGVTAAATTNATNVIPTSPQYGVAIISNAVNPSDMITENVTPVTETIVDTTAKPPDDIKELHSTPSRNDRFKVVKIASLEPFKRGRWKCMDYVDEAPPPNSQQNKVTQSSGSIQVAGGVYFQTQSLPQQQIQQMLLQGGFNGTQFVPTQVIPQGQYFYPQVTTIQTQTLPQQLVNSTGVPSSMPAQFISTSQPYFSGVVPNAAFTIPQNYPNIQYVPANLLQNQNSAFVPTSQTVQLPANFQQSQTYSGQPNTTQPTVTQPLVNGHAFPTQNDQVTPSSLPTQAAKNVILNASNQPPTSQSQVNQSNIQNQIPQANSQSQSVPVIQHQQFQQSQIYQQVPTQQKQNQNSSQVQGNVQTVSAIPIMQASGLIQMPQVVSVPSQNFDQSLASNVYTNPQFAMSVNSLSVLENIDNSTDNVGETGTASESTGESSDDPAKTNPVVNAIDNKIEQAMDLVKSHLMYTVREEVEVLKEKIAELMERIQQLESENNYLRSQIPKNQTSNVSPAPAANVNPPASSAPSTVNPAPINTPPVNPTPISNVVSSTGDIASQQ